MGERAVAQTRAWARAVALWDAFLESKLLPDWVPGRGTSWGYWALGAASGNPTRGGDSIFIQALSSLANGLGLNTVVPMSGPELAQMSEEFCRAALEAVRGALRRALKQGVDLAELGLGASELADLRCVSGISIPHPCFEPSPSSEITSTHLSCASTSGCGWP